MNIVGIILVKNEDRFIGRVVSNILDFCDDIIICDNMSTDRTFSILSELSGRYDKISLSRVKSINGTHDLLEKYIGGDHWIFAVDGDEIYDSVGLRRFKKRLQSGEFDKWWNIYGNVLNCIDVDEEGGVAKGYLSPPSRSMTKLYNFAAIWEWNNNHGERLHGSTPKFKNGYDDSLRCGLHLQVDWENADFRCLHACFTSRSSNESNKNGGFYARPQPIEQSGFRLKEWFAKIFKRKEPLSKWKIEKYAKGELVEKEVKIFFQDMNRTTR
jgi:glycosyltransferase involved in cell wall biosynthesis